MRRNVLADGVDFVISSSEYSGFVGSKAGGIDNVDFSASKKRQDVPQKRGGEFIVGSSQSVVRC